MSHTDLLDRLYARLSRHEADYEKLEAENARLRDALAHMLAFARRNWPDGVPDFEEQAVVIHAEAVMRRGT